MKKKKSGGGGANWMDTYGDMVTLLLCFFVLLYSMSTISEEKWRAIVTSFNPFAQETPTDPDGKGGPFSDPELGDTGMNQPDSDKIVEQAEIDEQMEQLYQALQQMAAQDGMQNTISVSMTGGKVYVKFNDTVFFDGDSYVLRPAAKEVLGQVCGVLDEAKDAIEEIRVQGHTAQAEANRPNDVTRDRRLASNRATEVVIYLQEHSAIHPARLLSEGYGQWRPISSNETGESRMANRRVEMIITGRKLDPKTLEDALSEYITRSGQGLDSTQNP